MKFYTLYIHIFISDMSEYTYIINAYLHISDIYDLSCNIYMYFRHVLKYVHYIYNSHIN